MAGTTPIPVDIQVELIMLEITIHPRVVGFEVLMIRMGIMQILIEDWVAMDILIRIVMDLSTIVDHRFLAQIELFNAAMPTDCKDLTK